ncbi:MAG: glutaredoxin domain-containing protein [Minisyncoccia bacterium]
MSKVTIYTTPSCVFCKMAKAFFEANKIGYSEKDVAVDIPARQAMIEKSGQMGVPVIDVNGSIVIGFDKERLAELLHL